VANGGLNDIVVSGVNGFLAKNPEELKKYVDKIDQCSSESCRKRVEEKFTGSSKKYCRISLHLDGSFC
jgi:hypothetical protein